MNAERIRKAAEWAQNWKVIENHSNPGSDGDARATDAAHILGKLASGEWVLCKGEPRRWIFRYEGLHGTVWATNPGGLNGQLPQESVSLHARITEEP